MSVSELGVGNMKVHGCRTWLSMAGVTGDTNVFHRGIELSTNVCSRGIMTSDLTGG